MEPSAEDDGNVYPANDNAVESSEQQPTEAAERLYLMIDGFTPVMGEQLACSVELISRGITFYICVAISGLITLAAYFKSKRYTLL